MSEGPGEAGDASGPTTREWLAELRLPFLTASIVPVLVGGAVALRLLGSLDWTLFGLTLLGAALLHLGSNTVNEYWDYLGGTDVVNVNRNPFSGGSGVLASGRLPPRGVLRLGIGLMAAGSVPGLVIVLLMGWDGWVVLALGAVGVAGGYFYSAPPLSLASKGVGELVIGLNFGVLVVLGTYYVQARELSWEALAASLPVSLWIAAVIWVNQFPDMEADGVTGKRTLVYRLGARRSTYVYSVIQSLAVSALLAGVILEVLPPFVIVAIVTLVPAALAVTVLSRTHGNYPDMEPAMRWTVLAHLAGGILVCLGFLA